MPAPGDQHQDTAVTANPFVERQRVISQYTAQEIATLQSRLQKQLGPEYVSNRPGFNGAKVFYLSAEKAIALANEVFGFNGWSSSVTNMQVDFVDENETNGKVSLGLSALVKVTLKDGTYHEDLGYGFSEKTKGKATAFEKAKKEAVTDGLKRALRNFGNVLGNCLYDKTYLNRVSKLKTAPSYWSEDDLHRHGSHVPRTDTTSHAPNHVPSGPVVQSGVSKPSAPTAVPATKQEPQASRQPQSHNSRNMNKDFEDEFGDGGFMESCADEIILEGEFTGGNIVGGERSPQKAQPTTAQVTNPPVLYQPRPQPQANAQHSATRPPPPPALVNAAATRPMPPPSGNNNAPTSARPLPHGAAPSRPQTPINQKPLPLPQNGNVKPVPEDAPIIEEKPIPPGAPVGFISGRSAEHVVKGNGVQPGTDVRMFDPQLNSPSIPRAQPDMARKSMPIYKNSINSPGPNKAVGSADGPPTPGGRPNTRNFVNPSADPTRRVGMPPGGPVKANAYRPPSKRTAMSDVSNLQQLDETLESKKPKLESSHPKDLDVANQQNVAPQG